MLARREDFDTAMNKQRPPDNTSDLHHCFASALTVPRRHEEALKWEPSPLWRDARDREATGLVDADMFKGV